jgi:2-succinyl-5-enolpyruvyl-6-hydroxy-3-cyclohexene-1-carboxylate synthase
VNAELKEFFNPSKKPKLLEIMTPRSLNDEVLLEYFDFIKS